MYENFLLCQDTHVQTPGLYHDTSQSVDCHNVILPERGLAGVLTYYIEQISWCYSISCTQTSGSYHSTRQSEYCQCFVLPVRVLAGASQTVSEQDPPAGPEIVGS